MTPIEQARLRMPPALPMSLAPRDGTPVLVCGVVFRETESAPGGNSQWKSAFFDGDEWVVLGTGLSKPWEWFPNPLGWLPLPDVLTSPVEEMPPVPQAPIVPIGAHKPSSVCWRCEGRRKVKVPRGEPSQGHDWEPCELCSPVPPTPERHKPLPYPEDDA